MINIRYRPFPLVLITNGTNCIGGLVTLIVNVYFKPNRPKYHTITSQINNGCYKRVGQMVGTILTCIGVCDIQSTLMGHRETSSIVVWSRFPLRCEIIIIFFKKKEEEKNPSLVVSWENVRHATNTSTTNMTLLFTYNES